MKTRTFSPLLLLVSLALGLTAMWVVASPVGATGDLVTGGWTHCGYACTGMSWDPCVTTTVESCSAYEHGDCGSGYISVATCAPSGQYEAYAARLPGPCSGCTWIPSATCY